MGVGGYWGNSPDIGAWLALVGTDGVGPTIGARLVERFGGPGPALKASVRDLAQVEGIGPQVAERIVASRGRFDVDAELDLAADMGVWIIHIQDPRYPAPLKGIYDPPPVLYVKGQLRPEHQLAVAIVGSRHCSLYGQEQASKLAYQLSGAGFTIVSGLARGVDTAAHQGALAAKGQTVAVQGCGLARVFPPENAKLYEMICGAGACISELPLRYEPLAHHFPARNRIIAGMSLATVVVEAGPRSGALITARCALDAGREVMAVPGRVDSHLSKGPHRLIKEGAVLVESAEDVLDALGQIGALMKGPLEAVTEPGADQPRPAPRLAANEQLVYERIGKEPLHPDQIASETGLPAGQVAASLVGLQLKGLVRNLPGNMFVRR